MRQWQPEPVVVELCQQGNSSVSLGNFVKFPITILAFNQLGKALQALGPRVWGGGHGRCMHANLGSKGGCICSQGSTYMPA